MGSVVTSNPVWDINYRKSLDILSFFSLFEPSCRGHAHHVFVSFAQTDVVRIGQMKVGTRDLLCFIIIPNIGLPRSNSGGMRTSL